jgi:MFS superfamily sulfate permease-like transporter
MSQIGQTSVPTLIVAVVVLVVIVALRMVAERVPGPLIAVIGSIAASYALNPAAYGVVPLGPVPGGLPAIGLPDVSWTYVPQLLTTSIAMFVVILAQSAATSRAYAARYEESVDENSDLLGLSLANAVAGLTGTFVVNGSPTKTQMVSTAGGRTQLAQLTCAVVVLVVLLLLTGPLAFMPTAGLAAIVFLIGVEVVDLRGMRRILTMRPREFWAALLTAVVVVVVGVEQARRCPDLSSTASATACTTRMRRSSYSRRYSWQNAGRCRRAGCVSTVVRSMTSTSPRGRCSFRSPTH